MLAGLLDLVLPAPCAGCGAGRAGLCGGCAAVLAGEASKWSANRPETWALTAYEGPVRSLIVAHKERGRATLTRPLGRAVASVVRQAYGDGPWTLVPVPSAARAVRRRGADATLRMARVAAAELGVRCAGVLRQSPGTADQAGLGAAGRRRNMAGAMRAPGSLAGLAVVLVDDVTTSGASLAEACRAVEAAGGRVRGAAVLAATVSDKM